MPAGTLVAAGSLVSPGGQQGPSGPNAVSADTGNVATFGSDNKIYVPDPTPVITSVRLRSYNAIGNPNTEVGQINPTWTGGTPTAGISQKAIDRWWYIVPTAPASLNISPTSTNVVLPGTNFLITTGTYKFTLLTQKASLAATDQLVFWQSVEGSQLRELINDVHSVSLLVRSSIAGLTFGMALRTGASPYYALTKLCTIPSANTWTLVTLPNLPIWTSSGTWPLVPGNIGYTFFITLAVGSTYMSPANDIWQSGNLVGASGQANFCAQAVNSTFEFAFVQHEPGALCTTLIDKPFNQNYDECLRYYSKSYDYGTAFGTVTNNGRKDWMSPGATTVGTGLLSFLKPMAKIPTVTIYNPNTGAVNSIRDGAAVDHAVTGVSGVGLSGFAYITFTTATTAVSNISGHYIADTGW